MPDFSIVYVLVNPAMPGLVKIGRTSQEEVGTRLAQLYTTGVPVPFELKYACRVPNSDEVECALHVAFGPQRINLKREFFRIEPDQAIAILKLLHVEDATAEVAAQATGIDEQSLAAAEGMRQRRPNLDFHEMGFPMELFLTAYPRQRLSQSAVQRKSNSETQRCRLRQPLARSCSSTTAYSRVRTGRIKESRFTISTRKRTETSISTIVEDCRNR